MKSRAGWAVMGVMHERDEDCTVGPDGCCVECGVSHTGGCAECAGAGFHRKGCSEVEPRKFRRGRAVMVSMADRTPSASFARALARNSHAMAELREASNLTREGYGQRSSEASQLLGAAEEILRVAHSLIKREMEHHTEQESRNSKEVAR